MQSQLWVLQLVSQLPHPLKEESHYRLSDPTNPRTAYGVDHESYVYQLAVDMGSAPSISDIVPLGWKMTLCWALSAQVNPKFRLIGPWKWSGARKIMENEIWETIARRRGFFGHLLLSVVPILIFGSLSAVLWVVEQVWCCGKKMVGWNRGLVVLYFFFSIWVVYFVCNL